MPVCFTGTLVPEESLDKFQRFLRRLQMRPRGIYIAGGERVVCLLHIQADVDIRLKDIRSQAESLGSELALNAW
jgi:hypothetical protein